MLSTNTGDLSGQAGCQGLLRRAAGAGQGGEVPGRALQRPASLRPGDSQEMTISMTSIKWPPTTTPERRATSPPMCWKRATIRSCGHIRARLRRGGVHPYGQGFARSPGSSRVIAVDPDSNAFERMTATEDAEGNIVMEMGQCPPARWTSATHQAKACRKRSGQKSGRPGATRSWTSIAAMSAWKNCGPATPAGGCQPYLCRGEGHEQPEGHPRHGFRVWRLDGQPSRRSVSPIRAAVRTDRPVSAWTTASWTTAARPSAR